jgi:hypothetical protein
MTLVVTNAALEYDAMWFGRSPLVFRCNVFPASAGHESKLRHSPVRANRSEVKVKKSEALPSFPCIQLPLVWPSLLLLR